MDRLGGRVSLYFEGKSGEELFAYFVPEPVPPSSPRLNGGLLRETRQYGGEIVKSVEEFRRAWKSANPVGARFEEQVFSSYNPFSGDRAMLHNYSGRIRITEDAAYTFCTASTDSSFILIDGKLVVAWPGSHWVDGGLDGSKRGSVNLTRGLHTFQYLHANTKENSYAIAAIVLPGEDAHQVMPPQMFLPASYAYVSALERRDGAPTADFQWDNRFMVRFGPDELYKISFSVSVPDRDNHKWLWDFGDGTRDSGADLEHLYFRRGKHEVILRPEGRQEAAIRQIINIRPRYGQSENDDRRAHQLLREAVAQQKNIGIQPEGYATVCNGFLYLLREREAVAFVRQALEHASEIPSQKVFPLFYRMALEVQNVDEDYDLSERCFQAVIDLAVNPEQVTKARLHKVGLLNHCLNRPVEARKILEQIDTNLLKDSADRRIYRIYRADCALVLEGPGKAHDLYEAAGRAHPLTVGGQLDRLAKFKTDSAFFAVKNMLAQRLYREAFEEINQLEWDHPTEKMSPHLNLLKAEALVGHGKPNRAIVCLERALLGNADETYRPKLRLELARISLKLGLLAKAKTQITLIRKESPYSPEETESRELLVQLERAAESSFD